MPTKRKKSDHSGNGRPDKATSSKARATRARKMALKSAQNLVEQGIRVNCVAPGPVWTPLNPSDKAAKDVAEFGADTPLKRPAQPEEIAPAFVYFASEIDSSYVTGEVLTLLGGETTAA
jgi:NAD(P)-dependent dehydrogenase (short-subunit alcohol dehydrogenase family)